MVAGDNFGRKDRPSQRTRTVVGKSALDTSSLIAVAIGTGDRVEHYLMSVGAYDRWWRRSRCQTGLEFGKRV